MILKSWVTRLVLIFQILFWSRIFRAEAPTTIFWIVDLILTRTFFFKDQCWRRVEVTGRRRTNDGKRRDLFGPVRKKQFVASRSASPVKCCWPFVYKVCKRVLKEKWVDISSYSGFISVSEHLMSSWKWDVMKTLKKLLESSLCNVLMKSRPEQIFYTKFRWVQKKFKLLAPCDLLGIGPESWNSLDVQKTELFDHRSGTIHVSIFWTSNEFQLSGPIPSKSHGASNLNYF